MKIKMIILFIILMSMCLLLNGCTNNVDNNIAPETNNIEDNNYIEGYEYIKTIDCEALKKEVKFMKDGVIITATNEVYGYNVDQKYSNDTNCSKFEDTVEIMLIGEGKVYENNQQVSFNLEDLSMTKSITELTSRRIEPIKDAGYYIYMQGPAKEGSSNTMYGVKNNSNIIYSFELGLGTKKENGFNRTYYKVEKEQIDYELSDDEIIVDFLYNKKEADFVKDFIRTNKSYYGKRITNPEESEQYVDIKPEYEWYKDEVISKIIDEVVYISDTQLITKDGKVYNKK